MSLVFLKQKFRNTGWALFYWCDKVSMEMKIYDNHTKNLLYRHIIILWVFFSFIWLALPIFVRKLKGRWFSFFYLERCCYFRKRMRICLDNHSITQTQKRNRYCIHFILLSSALSYNFPIYYCTVYLGQYSAFLSTACSKTWFWQHLLSPKIYDFVGINKP